MPEQAATIPMVPESSPSIATSINETFTKAALYQQCSKSHILKHIDLTRVDVSVMRDLINRENLLNIRKLPIIFSKLVVKMGLEFACDKFPRAGSFIQPKQIRVDVEDDEMEFLLSTNSSFKPNLVFIVSKNIALSVLGDSVSSLRNKLLDTMNNTSSGGGGAADANTTPPAPVIQIDLPVSEPVRFTPPKTFTTILGDSMSPRSGTIKPLKRLNSSTSSKSKSTSSVSRRNSIASSKSSKSSTSSVASKSSSKSKHDDNASVLATTKAWVNKIDSDTAAATEPKRQKDILILENTVLNTLNDVLTEAPEDIADGGGSNKIALPMDRDFYENTKHDGGGSNSCYSFDPDDMDVDHEPTANNNSSSKPATPKHSAVYDNEDYEDEDENHDDEDDDDDDEMREHEAEPQQKKITVDNLKTTNMQPGSMANFDNILDLISVKTEEFSFLKNVNHHQAASSIEPIKLSPKPASKASSVKSFSLSNGLKRKQYDDDNFGFA